MSVAQMLGQALALQEAGRQAEAARLYATVLAASPGQPQALCMLGRIARQHGDTAAADRYLAAAAKVAPQAPQVMSEQGHLALSTGNTAAAIGHFTRLVDARPEFGDGHFNLAQALLNAGQFRRSVEHFERAVTGGLASVHEAMCGQGNALLGIGDEAAADAAFDRALEHVDNYAPALFGKAQVAAARGRFDESIGLCRSAVAAQPDFALAWQQLAESRRYESADDPDIVAMERLLAQSGTGTPDVEKLHFALAKVRDDLGQYDAASDHLLVANRHKRERLPRYNRQAQEVLTDAYLAASPASQAHGGAPDTTPVPIFIVGMPRSGTTLVERILGSHSRVQAGGELTALDGLVRTRLADYPDAAVDDERLDPLRAAYLAVATTVADGREFITDKFPGNLAHVGLIRRLFPESPVVLCRRNAADNALSLLFQDFPTANLYANDLDDIAHYQACQRRLADQWRQRFPESVTTVSYEALVAEQRGQTESVLRFCGLSWEESCMEFAASDGVVTSLSRWQVRQGLYTRSVDRWRHYASSMPALGSLSTQQSG